jgi:hypothetical protein
MKKYVLLFLILIILGLYFSSRKDEPLVFNNANNTFRLVIFERGKWPSRASLNISVLAIADSLPDVPGNVFIARSNGNTEALTDTTSYVRWLDDKTVQVVYNPGLAIEKKETLVNGVKIVYTLQQ